MAEDTVQKAIEKLRAEMDKDKNKPYIQVVGNFLIKHLNNNPQDAEKILIADKTIAKSIDDMKKAARKNAVGGCAVLTDQEGFEIVLKYFGIDAAEPETKPAVKEEPKKEESKAAGTDFNYSLDDFL